MTFPRHPDTARFTGVGEPIEEPERMLARLLGQVETATRGLMDHARDLETLVTLLRAENERLRWFADHFRTLAEANHALAGDAIAQSIGRGNEIDRLKGLLDAHAVCLAGQSEPPPGYVDEIEREAAGRELA